MPVDQIKSTATAVARPDSSTFANGFRQYLSSGEFSDITIVCGDRKYPVHKVVIFAHSKVLKAAMSGAFKESTTNEIDLTDDGPDAVERMVEYFYSGDYHDAAAEQNENLVRLTLHIGIYSLADKYDVPGLGALAMTYFQAILSKGAKARRKDDCMPCVRSIYESTPDSNTGLRDLFVDHVVESYMNDKWKKSEPLLKAAFLEIPQFGWDCFLRIQNGPNETMNDIWRKLRRH